MLNVGYRLVHRILTKPALRQAAPTAAVRAQVTALEQTATGGWRRWGALLLLAGLGLAAFSGPQIATAGQSGQQCLQAATGITDGCTANDVSLGTVQLATDPVTCTLGAPVNVLLKATSGSTSTNRYDIGIWLSENGDSAITGQSCYRDYLNPVKVDPDSTDLTNGYGPFRDSDEDACGDLRGTDPPSVYIFAATLLCADSNNDGIVDTSALVSWDINDNTICNGALDAVPSASSKCHVYWSHFGFRLTKVL